jgi:hypothetical protein
MSILDRFLGLISAVAYALRRSRIGPLRLHIGVMLLCLSGVAYLAYRGWRERVTPAYAVLIAVCLLVIGLLLWAERRRYIVFRSRHIVASERAAGLDPEQKLFLRGSGFFEVSNMRRYLMEVPVVFWPTQLADHILAAKVRAFSILGVGVPSNERGWWYIFLDPRKVIEIVPGELCFGLRLRPAVRVVYKAEKGREVVYLSGDDPEQFVVLLRELQTKVEAAQAMKRQ